MKLIKIMKFIIPILLITTTLQEVNANSLNQSITYEYIPVPNDLRVKVEYLLDAYPNQTVNVNVTIEALVNLTINYMKVELYTFNSTFLPFMFDSIPIIKERKKLSSNQLLNKTCNVAIPECASNVIYGKIVLNWSEEGTEEMETLEKKPTFIMTYLRNPELEELRSKIPKLEEENTKLKENITKLNETLIDFKNRYEGELTNTRNVITILAIITVFFVATTAYLYMRKPKHYWS